MEHKRNVHGVMGNVSLSGIAARIPFSDAVNSTLNRILFLAVCLFFALALARTEFMGISPLGTAFTAAFACMPLSKDKRYTPAAVLLGTLAGYMTKGMSVDVLRWCSSSVLAFTAGAIFRDMPYFRKKWFSPACAGFAFLTTNTIYLMSQPLNIKTAALYILELTGAMTAAYMYTPLARLIRDPRKVKSERPPNSVSEAEKQTALAAICLSAVCATAKTGLFAGMMLGRIIALYITMYASVFSAFYGCTAGFCMGAVTDAVITGTPCLTLVYGGAGLFAGACRKTGPFWQVIAFTIAHASLMPWIWHDAPLSVLYECFASGVMLFLTVKAMENRGMDIGTHNRQLSSVPISDIALQAQMQRLTAAFAAVGDAVRRRNHKNAMTAPNGLYTLAVERVCRGCVREQMCWHKDYGNTRAALNEAAEKIKASGRAVVQDFPPHFSARCAELAEFVNNINEFLALKESRMRYRQRVENDMQMLCAQYDAVTQVLEEVTDNMENRMESAEREEHELRMLLAKKGIALNTQVTKIAGRYTILIRTSAGVSKEVLRTVEDISSVLLDRLMRASPIENDEGVILREAEAFDAAIGACTNSRKGEEENGDCFTHFRTDDGMLYLVMSDGMGSGGGAARESAGLVDMLRGFLSSGISVKAGLRLLSTAYTIKNDGENFATCDVLKADIYSGLIEMWKCGAAPTYLFHAGGHIVRRIKAVSMPVGLPSPEPDAEYSKAKISDGDMAVMVTDGISEGEDEWLCALMAKNSFMRPNELARLIINSAAERRCDDDMSVMVVKFTAKR